MIAARGNAVRGGAIASNVWDMSDPKVKKNTHGGTQPCLHCLAARQRLTKASMPDRSTLPDKGILPDEGIPARLTGSALTKMSCLT